MKSTTSLIIVVFLTPVINIFGGDACATSTPQHAVRQNKGLEVTTKIGIVAGSQWKTLGKGKVFYAFRGMPYAEPPLGDLRFEPPVPARYRRGIYNARYERDICIQTHTLSIIGTEDCLYINVYTTQAPSSQYAKLLPVMFYIHGGTFLSGDGNYKSIGPDYILDEDVLLVSFNYRLGIFGFFSTGNLAAPGNNGLRDQILALQWTHDNIAAFGGDPNNVTIFGASSGGASVAYLLQTNLAKGLFQRAIMQGGTTLCGWTVSRTYGIGVELAKKLGLSANNSQSLIRFLRVVPEKILHLASFGAAGAIMASNPTSGLVIAPVLEPDHEGAVISKRTYGLLEKGDFSRVPVMAGFNSEEGNSMASVIKLLKLYISMYDMVPIRLVPLDMNIESLSVRHRVGTLIKLQYVGSDGHLVLSDKGFIRYLSDDQFLRPIRQYVKLVSKFVDTYFYRFSYVGELGNPKRGSKDGAGHYEEIEYLFVRDFKISNVDPNDQHTRLKLVRLWTNFAKYGNPTPVKDPLLQDVNWMKSNAENLPFLDIGENLTMKSNPDADHMHFWDHLYQTYGVPPFNTY